MEECGTGEGESVDEHDGGEEAPQQRHPHVTRHEAVRYFTGSLKRSHNRK